MELNNLLHFVELDEDNHYIFRGNDGELFRINCAETYRQLRDFYNNIIFSNNDINTSKLSSYMANRLPNIGSAILREIFFTQDTPPILENDLDDEEYFRKCQKQFLGFFIFPTYECNLNCTYCTYSGTYPKERRHIPISMEGSLIDDTIGYIRRSSSARKEVNIVFYGDEPLINFKGICRMIESLEQDRGKNYSFQLVTNGLLLNRSIIDFLAKRRIKMQLSLDGPSQIHDRYRKTKEGQPTHHKVVEKLNLIRSMNKDYYAKCIGISCTLAPPFNIKDVDRFFREDDLFSGFSGHKGNFSISIMNAEGTNFYCDADKSAFREQMMPFRDAYVNYLLSGDKDEIQFISSAMYEAPFYIFAQKCLSEIEKWRYPGECIPGIDGLAIGADGKIYVCNTFNRLSIGTVRNGVDKEMVRGLRQAHLEVRNKICRRCWLFRFCPTCLAAFKYAEREQSFDQVLNCKYTKDMAEDLLKMYIKVLTVAPKRLKEFLGR